MTEDPGQGENANPLHKERDVQQEEKTTTHLGPGFRETLTQFILYIFSVGKSRLLRGQSWGGEIESKGLLAIAYSHQVHARAKAHSTPGLDQRGVRNRPLPPQGWVGSEPQYRAQSEGTTAIPFLFRMLEQWKQPGVHGEEAGGLTRLGKPA